MTIRGFIYLLVGVFVGGFALANWSLIAQPTRLNLLLTQVDAPLGIVMLVMVVAVVAINLLVLETQRFAWQRQQRSLDSEIARLRALAEGTEASRIQSLSESIEREAAAVRAQLEQLLERLPSATSKQA